MGRSLCQGRNPLFAQSEWTIDLDAVGGSLSTATPPNLANVNIYPLLTSFSFNDGLLTYNSSDPLVRVVEFRASTSATGRAAAPTLLVPLPQPSIPSLQAWGAALLALLLAAVSALRLRPARSAHWGPPP